MLTQRSCDAVYNLKLTGGDCSCLLELMLYDLVFGLLERVGLLDAAGNPVAARIPLILAQLQLIPVRIENISQTPQMLSDGRYGTNRDSIEIPSEEKCVGGGTLGVCYIYIYLRLHDAIHGYIDFLYIPTLTMSSTNIPQTQTVALVHEIGGDVEFREDHPVPIPGHNEVLARVLYTGVCQSGTYSSNRYISIHTSSNQQTSIQKTAPHAVPTANPSPISDYPISAATRESDG